MKEKDKKRRFSKVKKDYGWTDREIDGEGLIGGVTFSSRCGPAEW